MCLSSAGWSPWARWSSAPVHGPQAAGARGRSSHHPCPRAGADGYSVRRGPLSADHGHSSNERAGDGPVWRRRRGDRRHRGLRDDGLLCGPASSRDRRADGAGGVASADAAIGAGGGGPTRGAWCRLGLGGARGQRRVPWSRSSSACGRRTAASISPSVAFSRLSAWPPRSFPHSVPPAWTRSPRYGTSRGRKAPVQRGPRASQVRQRRRPREHQPCQGEELCFNSAPVRAGALGKQQ